MYKIKVRDTKGEIKFKTEASKLSKPTTIINVRTIVTQKRFEHLKGIKFSDMSIQDDLQIHMIIGLEDMGKIKTGNMICGAMSP